MNYQIIKMNFHTSVHFGDGGLTKSKNTLCADTIFSALCIEALKYGKLEELIEMVKSDHIRLSDGLPYIGDRYYIPKPILKLKHEKEGDSNLKKDMKKLEYIPFNQLNQYLSGDMDIKKENGFFRENYGSFYMIEKVAIPENDDGTPYAIDTFTYKKNSGLYIIIAYRDDEDLYFIMDLLESLSLSGIGGKISSGLGKFNTVVGKNTDEYITRLKKGSYDTYISLTTSIPKESELDTTMQGAGYRLIKRGGFISSGSYADSYRKKKEGYLMAAGSTFHNEYEGELLDVSIEGSHPVYRYAKPIFMGVM